MATVTTLTQLPDQAGVFTAANRTAANASFTAQDTNNTNLNTDLATNTGSITTLQAQNAIFVPAAITASGAVDPHTAKSYAVTKAGVAVLTLAAPTATTDDGKVLFITSTTANAHTLTATNLLMTGTANVSVATFANIAGAGLMLMAYQAKWYVISATAITFS